MPGGGHWQKAICDLSAVLQMDHIQNRGTDLHFYLVEKMLSTEAQREDQMFLTLSGKRLRGVRG